jgi:hypothetical protein
VQVQHYITWAIESVSKYTRDKKIYACDILKHNNVLVWWDSWHCLRYHPTKVMENWILPRQYADIQPSLLCHPKRAQIHITWRRKLLICHTNFKFKYRKHFKEKSVNMKQEFLLLIVFSVREKQDCCICLIWHSILLCTHVCILRSSFMCGMHSEKWEWKQSHFTITYMKICEYQS